MLQQNKDNQQQSSHVIITDSWMVIKRAKYLKMSVVLKCNSAGLKTIKITKKKQEVDQVGSYNFKKELEDERHRCEDKKSASSRSYQII